MMTETPMSEGVPEKRRVALLVLNLILIAACLAALMMAVLGYTLYRSRQSTPSVPPTITRLPSLTPTLVPSANSQPDDHDHAAPNLIPNDHPQSLLVADPYANSDDHALSQPDPGESPGLRRRLHS